MSQNLNTGRRGRFVCLDSFFYSPELFVSKFQPSGINVPNVGYCSNYFPNPKCTLRACFLSAVPSGETSAVKVETQGKWAFYLDGASEPYN
jgi:hypothetical protein